MNVAPEIRIERGKQPEIIANRLADYSAKQLTNLFGRMIMAIQFKLQFAGNVALATHELNHVVAFERFLFGNHLPESIECYFHLFQIFLVESCNLVKRNDVEPIVEIAMACALHGEHLLVVTLKFGKGVLAEII